MSDYTIADEDRLNFDVIESAIKTTYGYTAGYREALLNQWKQDLETELRAQIAAEIRDAKKTGLTRTEAYGWHNNALDKAAHIAEGKP